MTTTPPETLITFPCDFVIKVIGLLTPTFVAEMTAITQKYFPEFTPANIQYNTSKQSKYLALTLTVHALDKKTLDKLYFELSAHPNCKMVL
jgi:putative lipoic acid-binding regulatory protein